MARPGCLFPKMCRAGSAPTFANLTSLAPGYSERVMRWASTTGMVLNVVSSKHTVQLSRGVSLSGVAMDDAGKPLAGLRIGAIAFNFDGETQRPFVGWPGPLIRTPVVHQEDYSSYCSPSDQPQS